MWEKISFCGERYLFVRKDICVLGKSSMSSGTITFAHKIQTSDLCRCVQVRFELKDEMKNEHVLLRSPGASTEKDDRIRELEIMVRSLEEKLTR